MSTIDDAKLRSFFEVFQQESDRACGVLSAALLDTHLSTLLRLALRSETPEEWFEGREVLGSFSAKIDMAYYMALISDEDYRDLHLIRKIRNEFAHELDHTLGFASQQVSNRVRELSLPKILFEHPTLRMSIDTPRQRFQVGVGILSYLLTSVRTSDVHRRKPPPTLSAVILAV
jgi:hypothetical protein